MYGNSGLTVIGGIYMANKPNWFEYFFTMGAKQRKFVGEWCRDTKPVTERQKEFFELASRAYINCQYLYRLPIIEPSNDGNDNICYGIGLEPWTFKNFHNCVNASEKFAPAYASKLANTYELAMWYAYRIANGDCTIEFICDDSSSAGNYENSPNGIGKLAKTGSMAVAGAIDGIGNTYKITEAVDVDYGFDVSGGIYICDGKKRPVANISTHVLNEGYFMGYYDGGVPVVVLHK